MNPRSSSALAAVLLTGSVAAELLWPGFGDRRIGEVVLPCANALGWVLVLATLAGLPAPEPGRRARVGRWTLRSGAVLQVAFGAAYAGSAALLDEPAEAAFVLFAVGFLLLAVGGVTLGRVYWRQGFQLAGAGLRLVAGLGLLAIAVEDDPWHDISLLSSYAAWVLVGLGASSALGRDQDAGVRGDHHLDSGEPVVG